MDSPFKIQKLIDETNLRAIRISQRKDFSALSRGENPVRIRGTTAQCYSTKKRKYKESNEAGKQKFGKK